MTVHLKDDVAVDLDDFAAEVTDPIARREIWTHPSTEWYRGRGAIEDRGERCAPSDGPQ